MVPRGVISAETMRGDIYLYFIENIYPYISYIYVMVLYYIGKFYIPQAHKALVSVTEKYFL